METQNPQTLPSETVITAPQRYNELYVEVSKELYKLFDKLNLHHNKQKKEPSNWGYVGDLGHWLEVLKQINQ